MSSLHDKIPEIMAEFDFAKVHKVMTFLNWKWSDAVPPSIEELKSTASYLLHNCIAIFEARGCPPEGSLLATDGFQATITCFVAGRPRLSLLFYVDHWD